MNVRKVTRIILSVMLLITIMPVFSPVVDIHGEEGIDQNTDNQQDTNESSIEDLDVFNITIINDLSTGNISADKTSSIVAGEQVTLNAIATENYKFNNFKVYDENQIEYEVIMSNENNGYFIMPENNVIVEGVFALIEEETINEEVLNDYQEDLSVSDNEISLMADLESNSDSITYLYRFENTEEEKTITNNEYTILADFTDSELTSGTYVVDRDITLTGRLIISGEVKIILMDDKTLNSPYGVTVTGSNTLYVYGQEKESGKLIAGTAGNANSAAIGGGFKQDGGTMHFCSGTVEAKLDSNTSTGAAIGGGTRGNTGNITIHGGNITANAGAGKYGAGIGGGDEGYGGTVTIWGGTVNATGAEFGAGIGSGDQPGSAPVMTVNIKGGNITATGGDEAAGIGGGNEGNGANVTIEGNARVTANGGNDDVGEGAGIGGGDEGDGGDVTINGGYVKAQGGYRAAGIGGGADGSNTRVFINGGEVHTYGGGPANSGTRQSGGAGIGGGAYGYGGVIIITGGDVEAKGVWGGAGLGGGYGRNVTTVSISGDTTKVSANADKGAAAIGGGNGGDAYNISISGGEVNAEIITSASDIAGAAIGSGNKGYVANIAITGGTIKALSTYGNNGAAAIGGGNEGYFGNIRIEGGNITSAHAYNGGAGIGSGSGSVKKPEQAEAKITISGGTIRAGSSSSYAYFDTGAGIGSGSYSYSPVNIEISGGNIDAYCDAEGNSENLSKSGSGIGSGYESPMGSITITGGTIKATRGKGCKKADPIGHYNDSENSSAYYDVMTVYDAAQIRNEKGEGNNKRVTNTQYFTNAEISRKLALMENDSDWVEIKPCDHTDAELEITSSGEEGTHRLTCEYCISDNVEQVHVFDDENKCECGYYRYTLTFTDGQAGGQSKQVYAYPDYAEDGIHQVKVVTLSQYAPDPKFVVPGKEFIGWKKEGDDRVYGNNDTLDISADTTFVAQWNDLEGVTVVLSSIDGPLDQLNVEGLSVDTTINQLWNAAMRAGLEEKAASKNGYTLSMNWGTKPMTQAGNMEEFNDLSGDDNTVSDLENNILYVAMLKEIDSVEVTIGVPKCGTESETKLIETSWNQTNPPEVSVAEDSYETQNDVKWVENSSTTSYTTWTANIKGGETYYVNVSVYPVYGYAFKGTATNVVLNDEAMLLEDTLSRSQDRVGFNVAIEAVHDWDNWEVVTPATCSAPGIEERKCKVDGCDGTETREIEIDPDAHDYATPTYTWSDDNKTVTAKMVCSRSSEHTISEIATATSSVTKEPTCTEKGKTKYTAAFENEIFTNQSKTIEDIDALGHDWSEWVVTKKATLDEEGLEERICSRDPSHKESRIIPKLESQYINTEGNGNIWYKGSGITSDFTFKNIIDDTVTYSNFIGIKVDGNDVSKDNYIYEEGSVIIRLNPSYLETLSIGRHTLTALFKDDMSASAYFTVLRPNVPAIPKTGID